MIELYADDMEQVSKTRTSSQKAGASTDVWDTATQFPGFVSLALRLRSSHSTQKDEFIARIAESKKDKRSDPRAHDSRTNHGN